MACAANITAGAWNLPRHREREPEDNLISMSMKHPSKLQWSLVFNSVFIFCIFLVAIVTCLFRLDDFLKVPGHIVLVVLLLIAGALYSIYYLVMINSLYRIMKMTYGGSAIPI
ncbi:hypothetical protein HF086_005673 [Spodoptera exigua]|uniref:Uncharacterized protein n=1 Tax=Spodoptera exigua TaxID=7107 RepID=A0A922MY77_SPOEX|nr:hypothetical protein HF086_005673 [Spodoptera exigua]